MARRWLGPMRYSVGDVAGQAPEQQLTYEASPYRRERMQVVAEIKRQTQLDQALYKAAVKIYLEVRYIRSNCSSKGAPPPPKWGRGGQKIVDVKSC